MTSKHEDLPLAGVRIVELTDGLLDMTGRILGDFGADVIKVETSRTTRLSGTEGSAEPTLQFLVENFNKSGVTFESSNLAEDERFSELLASADIFIQTGHRYTDHPIVAEDLLSRFPQLVVLSVSDFGSTGPYSSYVATDAVHLAMGSQLSRSGVWPREPATIPFELAYHSSATQAAWAALSAYYQRLMRGTGDHIDFSVFEAAIELVDPPFGTAGTATAGTKTAGAPTDPYSSEWGRPQSKPYPIYPCADGFVRCLVLAPGQWKAMYRWLGEPEDFSDPKYQTILARDQDKDALERAYIELFRHQTKSDLAIEGQARGVPIAPVLSLAEVAAQSHFAQRGAFVEAELDDDIEALIPSGFVEIDGERIGFRHRAPHAGEHNELLSSISNSNLHVAPPTDPEQKPTPAGKSPLPLAGVRVIDFGSIVFGAEVGRLFADLGADVIKIENAAFPDKYRGGSEPGSLIAKNFALGNRGRRSFGVDTRAPEGRDLVKQLVASADVVVSNFKPGTLERLGLGYAELSAVNPQIVWMSASGFGETGDWASWLAYGPSVRSAAGLTALWRYPDDPSVFGDTTTVYPDHAAARIASVAILSALIRRRTSDHGADIRLSQAEVVINQLSHEFLREAEGLDPTEAPGAPWGAYQSAGDDNWCVICVRDDTDWSNFCAAMSHPAWTADPMYSDAEARMANRKQLDANITEWTSDRQAIAIMELLQSHGVPAGVMNRPPELVENPQLIARDYLGQQAQPGFDEPLNTVRRPFLSRHIDISAPRESPAMGRDTLAISSELLGLDASEVERLVSTGVLQPATNA
ncbi:CoA transferase [Rhodococcus qingshengii]|uniref:CaiB/BaiF CoA-transferase family protein n=1 Tax=Rhodococcus qingshengii TaxID=334542 RepID=UPI0010A5A9DA|nr:CoA transferase [Rhodococcus qingshengii]THJ64714.1 CoA transferase [Rhodococcus qingshengii]